MNFQKIKKIFLAMGGNRSVVNQWMFPHFISELDRYGVAFEVFNIDEARDENPEEALLKMIDHSKEEISLFMTFLPDQRLSVDTIKAIKKKGIPTLLFCNDNLSIPYDHQNIAPWFDLVWLTSGETMHLFRKWGAKTIFLPYAANPFRFLPSEGPEVPCIGFIGSIYGARSYKIKYLIDHNLPVQVCSNQKNIQEALTQAPSKKISFSSRISKELQNDLQLLSFKEGRVLLKGNLTKAYKKRFETKFVFDDYIKSGAVSFEEMSRLYSGFALSLGIIEVWNTYLLKKPLYKIHLRTFEIPMCGGLQITSRTPEIQQYFEEGKEIILYGSKEEMIDRMKFYLKDENEELRRKMKQAARIRAEEEHCWLKRFQKVEQA
ncbi:MAG: glycosyltransferase, partial [Bacteroidota bacterium]|nr:glycosyltransferase [Bacteroidota bacterium]